MLTVIQLMLLVFLTNPNHGEKLFHNRDHSDMHIPKSHRAPVITDEYEAELFLSRYGFIKPPQQEEIQMKQTDISFMPLSRDIPETSYGEVHKSESESQAFVSALKEFQMVSGLPVTGVFDDATKDAMNKPRCGVPDKEILENSWNETFNEIDKSLLTISNDTHKNNSLGNPTGNSSWTSSQKSGYMAFSKDVLRWRLIGEGYSSQLTIDEQRYIFRLAFRMWSEVSPLEFVEDTWSPLEDVDIKLGFGTGRHLGCNQKFDGTGQEFAHAWFLGDIHFDDDEHFTGPSSHTGISLLKVAVHEIGHVLGLPHIYRPGSIMQPSYLPYESSFEMDWMDRKAIQHLYGGCKGRFSTVFDWIRKEKTPYGDIRIRFNTYFMRDGWYWLYENRNNRTRYGDPVALQIGWHGIPSDGVDAYVHVWSTKREAVYFFRGLQFWRYDNENDRVFRHDSEGRRYPRLISEGFPGIPSPIDSAFYDRRDSRIYFFRRTQVYAFSVETNSLASGFPKHIRDVFPPVESGDHPDGSIDAAYFSYSHNALFLLKGTRFWRVVGSLERWRRPFLPRNGLMPHKEVDQQWFDICDVHLTSLKVSR
uniref:Matrix metallopeptidase 21 n=1 Tax=Xiphophorus couchianus TaxID=32473 RepID=A0A3B5LC03_9TELE